MTRDIGRRPLPRSLVPLPDESLAGYVLRLAHRLDRSPGRIAELTTLGNYRQDRVLALPAHLVVGLRPSVAANFAAAARLTTVEVAGLGLRRYSQVYPPLAGAGVQGDGRVLYNAWAFTAASRFCPNCLGGDGDRLQQAHGGPWRQQWHLPITFACVRHERLLEYLCPHCRRPPSGRLGVKTSLLLHIHCEALHPTQCRNHALDAPLRRPRLLCGEHLAGEVNSVTPILDAEALARCVALQARIQQRLRMSPEIESDPSYFHDLIAVAQLIIMSWPVPTRMVSTPASMVEALDTHIQDVRRKAQSLSNGRPRELLEPPTHPAACAALLLQADELLAGRQPSRLREVMPLLAEAASVEERARFGKLVNHQPMTDQLRLAMGLQHLGSRVDSRLRMAATQPISLPGAWISESQVPQLIPLEWYQRHLRPFTDTLATVTRDTVRHVRRAGALMLAQLASGNSVKECAEALRIPPGRADTSIRTLKSRSSSRDWQILQAGVQAIAQEIERAQNRVNYAQRRQILALWTIPDGAWEQMTYDMSPRICTQRQRKISTIVVWARVTEGDYLLSPLVRDEVCGRYQPQGKPISKGVAAFVSARTGERSILGERLGRYAERIAQWCDEQCVTSSA